MRKLLLILDTYPFLVTILQGIALLVIFYLLPSVHLKIIGATAVVTNSYSLQHERRTSKYRRKNAHYKAMEKDIEFRLMRKIQYSTIIAVVSGFIAHLCFSFREVASVMLMGGTILFGIICFASSIFAICFYNYFITDP